MRLAFVIGILWAATAAEAQPNAAVYNAASAPSLATPYAILSNPFAIVPVLEITVFSYPGSPPNIVAPRMKAVLNWNSEVLLPPASPLNHTAKLSIRPVGSSSQLPVNVLSATGNTVTFVVPAGVPSGAAQLSYAIDNGPTQWTMLTIVPSSFAFFAVAQTVSPSGALNPIGLSTPAAPGQLIQLTGSGLGYGAQVSLTVGGLPAVLSYAGPHPTQAGVDQILFQMPSGFSSGCYVPVTLTYNQTSVSTSISATADGSPCQHPLGLSLADEKTLDAGGSIFAGEIDVSSQFTGSLSNAVYRADTASVSVGSWSASSLNTSVLPSNPGCSLNTAQAGIVGFANSILTNFPPALPNLGAQTLAGAATTLNFAPSYGFYSSFDQQTAGTLSIPPTPELAGGKWTWQSSGSADLPASSFSFNLPTPLQTSGNVPLTLSRNQDQTLAWNGSAFDASAWVYASLTGHTANGTSVSLSCSARGAGGSLTIPAAMLAQFAGNSMGTLDLNLSESESGWPHARFALTSGQTLLMVVSYTGGDARPLDFQ